MKKTIVILAMVLALGRVGAQTDPLYTQYRSNMMSVNPAYAGSRDALTLGFLYRNQWVNLEGAPSTRTVTIHGPLKRNLGIGLGITNDVIGPTSQTGIFGNISGRIKLGTSTYFSGGVQLGFDYFSTNFVGITTSRPDRAFSEDVVSLLPNIGAGIYLYSEKFYLGFSVPKILSSTLFDGAVPAQDVKLKRHYTLIAGYIFNLTPDLKFKPTTLLRFVEGAPISNDITAEFVVADKFWLGAFYRWEESTGVILGYNITPQFKIGYSYDYTLSELIAVSSGSHEITLTYDFIYNGGKKIRSPRYF